MKHIMVDLETLSSESNAVLLSIGAVEFNPDTGTLGKRFYENVDAESCQRAGLHVSASTAMWWLEQTQAARFALRGAPLSLRLALERFSNYWRNLGRHNYFWSHATFDSVVLRSAYRAVDLKTPWHYREVLDIRTLVALASPTLKENLFSERNDLSIAHNALDDAIYQAGYISTIWQEIYRG